MTPELQNRLSAAQGKGAVPQRIQLKRTKGWRLPPHCIVVSRPSPFGNPFTLDDLLQEPGGNLDARAARAEAVRRFKVWLGVEPDPAGRFANLYPDRKATVLRRLPELRGKALACWCPLCYPDGSRCPCHAAVLLELANR
jgi:hypothetical protein